MNFLPAFYFPTTLICVDDEQLVLDGYKKLFADKFNCKAYQNPRVVQEYFSNYKSPLSQINFLTTIPEFEHDKFNIQSVVQLNIQNIIELAKSKTKYDEVSVLLADYYMPPEIDGLELCRTLVANPVKKMLLTGDQTYDTVRLAFNSGTIDYFANKTDSAIQIKEAVCDLSMNFFCEFTADFRKYLDTQSISPLSDAIFIEHFTDIIKNKNITEYYLIDKYGSYLLIAVDGKKYVLVVHNNQSLLEFVNILTEYEELADKVKLIENRQCIPFFGIGESVSSMNLLNIGSYLFDAYVLNGRQRYYLHLLEYNYEI